MHDFTGNAHTSGVSCQIVGHVALFLLSDYRCYDTVSRIVSKHRRGHSPTNILEIPSECRGSFASLYEPDVGNEHKNKWRIDVSCRMINTLCSNNCIEIYDGPEICEVQGKAICS